MTRSLSDIATDIYAHWPKVNYAAKPYLEAMATLDSIEDNYLFDSGKNMVRYFLSNASSFRGEHARRIKAELRSMV